MNTENNSDNTILNNTNNENDFNFSENFINKNKRYLALKILNLIDINDFDDKKYILYETLLDPKLLNKLKDMVPALKTVYKVSHIRSLNISTWKKNKHPGVNLLRQILKENGYKLQLINEFQGTENKKKVYLTKYIIIPI
jgi:hypothetical protein